MENWNYEKARKHADSIADITTRRLTQLFLTRCFLLVSQRYAVPENAEMDLLFYVKIVEKIVSNHALIKGCLEGEDLDSAWTALADEWEALQSNKKDRRVDP